MINPIFSTQSTNQLFKASPTSTQSSKFEWCCENCAEIEAYQLETHSFVYVTLSYTPQFLFKPKRICDVINFGLESVNFTFSGLQIIPSSRGIRHCFHTPNNGLVTQKLSFPSLPRCYEGANRGLHPVVEESHGKSSWEGGVKRG